MSYTEKTWAPTDPFLNTDANDISTALAETTADTGWIEKPTSGNWYTWYRKIGKLVMVRGYYSATVGAEGTSTDTKQTSEGWIPAEFAPNGNPSGETIMASYGSSSLMPAISVLYSDGHIIVKNNHSGAVPNIHFSATYFIA